jgi:hypothetical protein
MSTAVSSERFPALGYPVIRIPSETAALGWNALAFVIAHVPLALLMERVHHIATLHAAVTLIVGLRWAVSKANVHRVAYVGAYITAAEALWRMTDATVPWEFSKYATAGIFLVAIFWHGRPRVPRLALLYFALLIPAIAQPAMNEYLVADYLRQMISFHLSGPFALMVCTWFFSYLRLTSSQLERMFFAVIGPSLGIAIITLYSTATAENLSWGTHSNVITSGGYGPNQVSGALGLGALMALMLLVRSKSTFWIKVAIFVLMAFIATQAALTFSRGGLMSAAGAAVVGFLFMSRDRRTRLRIVFLVPLILVVAYFIIVPQLERLTGGALTERYEELSTTGRTEIALSDLSIWQENPVFGAGVGMSLFRKDGWRAAHTEFTRLLAEHGLFGLGAIILLIIMSWQRLRQTRSPEEKAFPATMFAWSFLFMLGYAMRLVAPSFAFGLAFAVHQDERQVVYDPRTGNVFEIS